MFNVYFQSPILGLMLDVLIFIQLEFGLANARLQTAGSFSCRTILTISGITKTLCLRNYAL